MFAGPGTALGEIAMSALKTVSVIERFLKVSAGLSEVIALVVNRF